MKENEKKFIETIGQAAGKNYAAYQILPSLTVAQAILESNWGQSRLAQECHNYFGMKWSQTASCGYQEYPTKEQKPDGTWYTILAKFRKYDSLEAGIRGYYEFLQFKRYQNLKGVRDYKKACLLIKEDGWATALAYTQSLINLIERYNLTQYDHEEPRETASQPPVQAAMLKQAEYEIGKIYTLQAEMKVRTGAGTQYRAMRHEELTADGKKHDPDQDGALEKGTKVTCKEVKHNGQDLWIRTPSGWIAAQYNGCVYIK